MLVFTQIKKSFCSHRPVFTFCLIACVIILLIQSSAVWTRIWHDMDYITAMAEAEYTPEFEPTKYKSLLALTGELWDAFCKDFDENWLHYNGTVVYTGWGGLGGWGGGWGGGVGGGGGGCWGGRGLWQQHVIHGCIFIPVIPQAASTGTITSSFLF